MYFTSAKAGYMKVQQHRVIRSRKHAKSVKFYILRNQNSSIRSQWKIQRREEKHFSQFSLTIRTRTLGYIFKKYKLWSGADSDHVRVRPFFPGWGRAERPYWFWKSIVWRETSGRMRLKARVAFEGRNAPLRKSRLFKRPLTKLL